MGSLTDGVKDAVSSAFCFAAKGSDGVAGLLSNLPIDISTIQRQTDRFRAFACGDDPMDSEPVGNSPGFSGGQCAGVLYSVSASVDEVNSGGGFVRSYTTSRVVPGPVRGLILGATKRSLALEFGVTEPYGSTSLFVFGSTSNTMANERINSVVRSDGAPDECGDPPVERPEPIEVYEDDIDIVYDDPLGNPVTLPNNPFKLFKPCLNLDGVRLPFEVTTPFGKICGKVGVAPDLTSIIEPNIDIDLCPEDKSGLGYSEDEISDFFVLLPEVGDSVAFPDNDYSADTYSQFGEDENPILGAFIRARKALPAGGGKTILLNDESSTAPNIIIPRIGSIFFEYYVEIEGGYESAFSEDIPIKNVNQFIPCPWEYGAVRVHCRKEIGWDFAVIPVARKTCCEACKSNDPNDGLDNLDRCRID